MQHVSEIMSYDVAVMSPSDSTLQAIKKMNEWNISAIPVCEDNQIIGIISKTDIAEQIPTIDRPLDDIKISEIMVREVFHAYDDQTVEEVLHQMTGRMIRHLPVLNRHHELVGIVSLTDLANRVAGYPEDLAEQANDAFGDHALSSYPTRIHQPLSDSAQGDF